MKVWAIFALVNLSAGINIRNLHHKSTSHKKTSSPCVYSTGDEIGITAGLKDLTQITVSGKKANFVGDGKNIDVSLSQTDFIKSAATVLS